MGFSPPNPRAICGAFGPTHFSHFYRAISATQNPFRTQLLRNCNISNFTQSVPGDGLLQPHRSKPLSDYVKVGPRCAHSIGACNGDVHTNGYGI